MFNDLKTNCFDWNEIKSAIVIYPKFLIIGLLEAAKALFVSIRAALFCSCKSVFEPPTVVENIFPYMPLLQF